MVSVPSRGTGSFDLSVTISLMISVKSSFRPLSGNRVFRLPTYRNVHILFRWFPSPLGEQGLSTYGACPICGHTNQFPSPLGEQGLSTFTHENFINLQHSGFRPLSGNRVFRRYGHLKQSVLAALLETRKSIANKQQREAQRQARRAKIALIEIYSPPEGCSHIRQTPAPCSYPTSYKA